MIVELYGLPGSGKSTLCSKLEKENGMNNIMFFYKEKFIGKIMYHIFLIFFVFDFKLKRIYKEIITILGDYLNNKNCIDESVHLNLYVKYIMFIYYIEQKNKNKDICIDEGIIHLCMAIYAEYSVPFDVLDDIIKVTNINCEKKLIKVECSVDTAMGQATKRNRKRAPIDFIDSSKLRSILKLYKEAEEYFSYKYDK